MPQPDLVDLGAAAADDAADEIVGYLHLVHDVVLLKEPGRWRRATVVVWTGAGRRSRRPRVAAHAQTYSVEFNLLKAKGPNDHLHCSIIYDVHTHTRSTQPCIPPGSLNRVPASAGVKAGLSPLPGGR